MKEGKFMETVLLMLAEDSSANPEVCGKEREKERKFFLMTVRSEGRTVCSFSCSNTAPISDFDTLPSCERIHKIFSVERDPYD